MTKWLSNLINLKPETYFSCDLWIDKVSDHLATQEAGYFVCHKIFGSRFATLPSLSM